MFTRSGLSREELKAIWLLSDIDRDNKLTILEFAIATHLIMCKTRKNLPIPTTLPGELHPSSLRPGAGAPQPVQQQASPGAPAGWTTF
jgi:hypothetical protein